MEYNLPVEISASSVIRFLSKKGLITEVLFSGESRKSIVQAKIVFMKLFNLFISKTKLQHFGR